VLLEADARDVCLSSTSLAIFAKYDGSNGSSFCSGGNVGVAIAI